ncbi:MAG: toll/interleukin-1 receptor domain-containing protein [Pseudomonadota bacterium]
MRALDCMLWGDSAVKKVFISYSRTSEAQVKDLIDDLRKLGLEALSDRNLPGGQPWWDRILDQIDSADVVIVAIDEAFTHSIAVRREYQYARDLDIPVLPVVVAGEIRTEDWPDGLDDLQWVDYRGDHRDGGLFLGRAFGAMRDRGPMPDPPPNRPPLPKSDLDRLKDKVASAEPLSLEDQSSIVIALKSKLRIAHEADKAVSVLKALQDRRDLLKTIDREIEEALEVHGSPFTKPTNTSNDQKQDHDPKPVEKYGLGEHALGSALIGFFAGIVISGTVELGIGFAIIGSVIGLIIALVSPIKKSSET